MKHIRPPYTTVATVDDIPTAADEQPIPHTHPVVNGRVLLPGGVFVARNRISGECHTYVYLGEMGLSCGGEEYVRAADVKGNSRSIAVETIVTVRPMREVKP